jgi:hypothetical protein
VDDLTPYREWASLPGEVNVCNFHRDELVKSETEWVLIRDDRKVYVGDQLRKLDEYILLEAPTELRASGSDRELSGRGLHSRARDRQSAGSTIRQVMRVVAAVVGAITTAATPTSPCGTATSRWS